MSDETENPKVPENAPESQLGQPFENEPNPLMDKSSATAEPSSSDPEREKILAEAPAEEKSPLADQFAFIQKQPTYIKVSAALLVLFALLWFGISKCSSSVPTEKTFLIALDNTWYPLKLKSKEKSMTNFTKMLFASIASTKNLRLRVVESGPNMFQLLERGEVDGAISFLQSPLDFNTQFISSDSIYQLGFVLVVKNNSPIKSPDKIAGMLIGIIGNAQILIKIAQFSSTIFTNYQSSALALADLDSGIIDGVIMDVLEASSYLQGLYAGNFRILYPPLVSEGIELYLRKNRESAEFLDLFNQGLKEVRANGTYHHLIDQWSLLNTEERENPQRSQTSPP